MIAKLMNQERSYGEPEYSKTAAQIERLRQKLQEQLAPGAQALLEQLIAASIHRENILAEDAFVEGFYTAIEIVLELYTHTS